MHETAKITWPNLYSTGVLIGFSRPLDIHNSPCLSTHGVFYVGNVEFTNMQVPRINPSILAVRTYHQVLQRTYPTLQPQYKTLRNNICCMKGCKGMIDRVICVNYRRPEVLHCLSSILSTEEQESILS
jgi:hypothetical protein